MTNICVIGSSLAWTPTLVTDLMSVFSEPLEIRLLDLNPEMSRLCAEWGEAATRHHGRKDVFVPCTDRREALRGADGVIITLSTGGLDAMEHDLKIPEKYGIFATVGDTAGAGGWSRSVRNIPVFRAIAEDLDTVCPTAFVANYTNPLSALTATLQQCCRNPACGFCHAYFETKDVIQKIFGLKDWSTISIAIAGMNHFTWVVDFKIGREDGYPLLRQKIGKGSLRDVLPAESADEIGIYSGHKLCVEFYDAFGYLPYPADRHTSEFVSFALTGNPPRREAKLHSGESCEMVEYCDLKRTTIDHRRKGMSGQRERIQKLTSGETPMPVKSRETGAEMIRAYLQNKPFMDAVNLLNQGQIPGLPAGACVETLGVVDGLGVRPLQVTGIPEPLLEIMRPQAICQKWIVQGVLEDREELLLQALYRDPQCAHLKPHDVRQMAAELIAANHRFARAQE